MPFFSMFTCLRLIALFPFDNMLEKGLDRIRLCLLTVTTDLFYSFLNSGYEPGHTNPSNPPRNPEGEVGFSSSVSFFREDSLGGKLTYQ